MFGFFKRKKAQGWIVYHAELDGNPTIVRLNNDFSNPKGYRFHIGIAFPLESFGYQSFPPPPDKAELDFLEDKLCEYFESRGGICVAAIINRKFKEVDFFVPDNSGLQEDYEAGALNFSEKFSFQMLAELDTKGEFFKTIKGMLGLS